MEILATSAYALHGTPCPCLSLPIPVSLRPIGSVESSPQLRLLRVCKIRQSILEETLKVKPRMVQKLDGVDIHRHDPFDGLPKLDLVYPTIHQGADKKAVGLRL
jgi:hypothetical protein